MAKSRTTIIFVDTTERIRNPLTIPTFLLKYWKLLFLVFLTIVGSTVYFSIWMGQQYLLKHKNELAEEKSKFILKSEKLEIQHDYINKKINEVTSLLEMRGIKLLNPKDSKGSKNFDLTSVETGNDQLIKKIDEFQAVLIHTPIGYPLEGNISSNYGLRSNPFHGNNSEFHGGLDIRAKHGSPVRATAKGEVIFAGSKSGYGRLVIIDHGNDLQTYYAHLSKILVKTGQIIDVNEVLGNVGSSGRATGPHLHYEIRENQKTLNPDLYLSTE